MIVDDVNLFQTVDLTIEFNEKDMPSHQDVYIHRGVRLIILIILITLISLQHWCWVSLIDSHIPPIFGCFRLIPDHLTRYPYSVTP